MKAPDNIIIIEPQCWGLEHVEVNAGLILVIQTAFPHADIHFMSESEHLKLVEVSCKELGCGPVYYHVVTPPARGAGEAKRFIHEWGLTHQVLECAKAAGAGWVVFASITGAGLWSVRLLAPRFKSIHISIIPHIILASITRIPKLSKPWNWPFWFRLPLVFGNTSQIQFILLGEFIKREVILHLPRMAQYIVALDLPCRVGSAENSQLMGIETITFGSIGGARVRKGSHLFFQLAKRCARLPGTTLNFVLVGQIEEDEIRSMVTDGVTLPSFDRPLPRRLFTEIVMNIDYAIFCYNSEEYRFGTSGAFFDALMYLKPIITLRCPSIEYYFEAFGDIGYVCESMDHMYEVVKSIAAMPPNDRYSLQVENLRRGRYKLNPITLGLNLRDIMQNSQL